jgi:hypothetical protein
VYDSGMGVFRMRSLFPRMSSNSVCVRRPGKH